MMKNVALITGASSGIGRELAYIHAEKTGDLVIVARREDELNEVKKEIEEKYSRKVKIISKDLAIEESPKEIYEQLKSEEMEIEYLINNAGFGGQGKFYERDWGKDRSMIQVNIVALTALTRLFLHDFVERNSGKIMNVSSIASLMPGPLQAVYYATKAYVQSFSNALVGELEGTNVTVTALMPGATKTGFEDRGDLEKTKLFENAVSAKIVAEQGYDAMMKGEPKVIAGVGFTQKLLLGLIPFIPLKRRLSMVKNMQEVI